MYVWQPSGVEVPKAASVAFAPVAGDPLLASYLQQAILDQRPAAAGNLALFSPEQLAASSPIRLASTAPLNNDLSALLAARAAGANVLVQGEIVRTDLTLEDFQSSDTPVSSSTSNLNQLGLQRLLGGNRPQDQRNLLLSWRVLDVNDGKLLGAHSFNINTAQAAKSYPDLQGTDSILGTRLVSAAARETWKSIAPAVTKSKVKLSVPWLQPGSFWVRRGNRAAKKGDWALAEKRWETTTKWFWFNAPAKHNLAIAHAAREDFIEAKQTLGRARGPFASRLPTETLFWLDQHHRAYNMAHGLGEPPEGWAIPHSSEVQVNSIDAPPIELDELPWWTAMPFAKPPEWTWQEYFALATPW